MPITANDDVFDEEVPTMASRMRSRSLLGIHDQVTYALTRQLKEMHKKLQLKENERNYLNKVPQKLTDELRELDITLEKEANTLIREGNEQRAHAEKMLREANYKVDGLQAEVNFLKTLVLTSTPSNPNRHLHPQLEKKKKTIIKQPKFVASLRRSISMGHSLNRHSRGEDEPRTPPSPAPNTPPVDEVDEKHARDTGEVDHVYLSELEVWRKSQPSTVDITTPFLNRIIREDVNPCLNFQNKQLSSGVFHALIDNRISIEPTPSTSSKPCALTGRTRGCNFVIRLGEDGPCHTIARNARNRVAAACNFFMYIGYITQGLLVSREDNVVYWDVMELRKQMVLARLDLL